MKNLLLVTQILVSCLWFEGIHVHGPTYWLLGATQRQKKCLLTKVHTHTCSIVSLYACIQGDLVWQLSGS